MSKFSIYQDKKGEAENLDGPDCSGLGEKVVWYLTNDLFGKSHKVFFDHYVSSVPLAKYLALNKVLYYETIRTNRKYLATMKGDKELNRGDFNYCILNQDIAVYKWMDNKAINVISNFHGTERD